jgi:two-component system, OmpR family, response regulator
VSNRNCPRLLVVDDVTDGADSMGLLLGLWGYSVAVCYDGKAALELARSYRPHAVLLDIGLPGMDGFQVALGLRGIPELADTLIIGITGHADETCRTLAGAAGFDHYLIKPEDPAHLRGLLARAVPLPAIPSKRRIEALLPVGWLLHKER